MSDIARMPSGIIQNELNMIMREASTLAMLESSNNKKEVITQPTADSQFPQITCTNETAGDGTALLVCSFIIALLNK